MRKNIATIIEAFKNRKRASDKTCSTDGENIFSYAMKIASRDENGVVVIVPYDSAPSRTTASMIRACMDAFGKV